MKASLFSSDNPVTVKDYLTDLNEALRCQEARVIGEVSELQLYPGRSYLFFSLKDGAENALIKCMMWKTDYQRSGIEIEDGMEIIVSGYPRIYEPSGSLTLSPQAIELVGEGALKKAYDKLKTKLEGEGLFGEEKKRTIPDFAKKIGIITSRSGAVIHDFLSNIGKHGYEITMIDSRVEGQLATGELIQSIKTLRKKDIDVLVIIRGGGSLESLQPFNNELLVREISDFPVPVIAGIGHDKDITLASLAADKMVSTPTAVTVLLNESWSRAQGEVQILEHTLISVFDEVLRDQKNEIEYAMSDIREHFRSIFETFYSYERKLMEQFAHIRHRISDGKKTIARLGERMVQVFTTVLTHQAQSLQFMEKQLEMNNPERQLKLGYSIIRAKGKVLRSVKGIKKGETLEVRLQDGTIESEVTHINT